MQTRRSEAGSRVLVRSREFISSSGVSVRPVNASILFVIIGAVAACGGGSGGGSRIDTRPDAFSFPGAFQVALSALITSDAVTITGVAAPAPVTVSGGEYSIGCGATFTSQPGEIGNGETVCVRHVSSASYGTSVVTILKVGGFSATFTSTTVAGPAIALGRVFPNLIFSRPVAMVQAPADSTRWFVVEQSGLVRAFANSQAAAAASTFVDISARVGDSSGERGLYSLAFDPDFAVNHYAYLSYTRSSPSLTSYVSRFTSIDGGQTLDPASEAVIITLPQPFTNHNGGQIAFGPDGFLYIAFGDGGSANDPGDRAQDTTSLYGTILRIDVSALPYTIPAGNPFFGNARCPDGSGTAACPEIFAWGLRNSWRFSFDSLDGSLWAADVGQDLWEEVDLIVNGGNYGWRIREGAHCNIPPAGCVTAGLSDPVAEYGHAVGESITGGFVYRGSLLPALTGSYLFGDYISGRLFRIAPAGSQVEELLDTAYSISSFGEANDGEVYVIDYGGGRLYQVIEAT
jgi:glucose/arabinose dehydrogenase